MSKKQNAEFDSVAARVETELGSPAAILITSALDNDGTTMVGSCLSDALAASGYRVVFVDGRTGTQKGTKPATTMLHPQDAALKNTHTYAGVSVRDLGENFAGSRRDVSALIARLRLKYDYVIVDAPSFTIGALPTLFADVCDGVIVGVARGRAATGGDRGLTTFLEAATKHTIGIVASTRAAIVAFDAAEAQHPARRTLPLAEVLEDRAPRVPVVAGSA